MPSVATNDQVRHRQLTSGKESEYLVLSSTAQMMLARKKGGQGGSKRPWEIA